jgi:hypothetical protein
MKVAESSPRLQARLAGVCYLITIGAGAFDHLFVGAKLIVPGDAAATANNILASASLYRLAFALDMIPVYAVVTVLFYQLFRPVNQSLSLLAAFSSLLGGAVGSGAGVFQLAPLVILGDTPGVGGLGIEQRQALAMMFLKLHESGFTISLMFFGFYCLLLGWLIIASTFMPRAVGVLLVVGGLAYMTYSFADFVSPHLAAGFASWPLLLGTLGEVALTLWLLVVGLNASRWREQAAASAAGADLKKRS